VRYFFGKLHNLSHHSMEQQAEVSRQVQESLSATSLIKVLAVEQRTTGQVMGTLYSLRDQPSSRPPSTGWPVRP
jgi:hypothetical protein